MTQQIKNLFNKDKYNFVLCSLIYFLPFSLITGPFLPDLTISLISLIFLKKILLKKELKKYFNNIFSYIFFIFYIYIIIRSLTSNNPLLSLESSLFFIRFLIFIIVTKYLYENIKNFNFNFFVAILIPLIIIIFDGSMQLFFGHNMFLQDKPGNRLYLFTSNEWIFGSYASRILPLLFAFVFLNTYKSFIFILIAITVLVMFDLLIFSSGERAAFFLLSLSTVYIIILTKKYKYIRLISLIISIFFIYLLLTFSTEIKYRMIDQTAEQIGLGYEYTNIFSDQHQRHYFTAYKMFIDKPIFGHGPKMFREVCKEAEYKHFNGCSTHPHNVPLHFLSETGIIGFFFYLVIVFYLSTVSLRQFYLKFIKKSFYIEDHKICLLACILISSWPLIPSGSIFNNWLAIINFLPIGFLLSNNNQKDLQIK